MKARALKQTIEDGYTVIPDVMDERTCTRLLADLLEWTSGSSRAGTRNLMACPPVREIAAQDHLVSLAAAILGCAATPYRATLFNKSPDSNWLVTWHQDTALPLQTQLASPEWGPWSTKHGVIYARAPAWALERVATLRVHLDNCHADAGPLRVIPGTHKHGVLSAEAIAHLANSLTPVDCLSARGGVLAMSPLLVHGSSKSRNSSLRRILHIEYAPSEGIAPGIHLALA